LNIATGRVLVTGNNGFGQLGLGTFSDALSPSYIPQTGVFAASANIKIASAICGYYHLILVDTNGAVYASGRNSEGQLGLGNLEGRNRFAQIKNGFSSNKIKGGCAGDAFTLAYDEEGTLFSWGYGRWGQLANGTISSSSSPINASSVPAGEKVSQLSCGADFVIALMKSGKVYSWGHNAGGQLGNGALVDSYVPVDISASGSLASYTPASVTAGYAFAAVLTTSGNVISWGLNDEGQLGAGNRIATATPTLVSTTVTFSELKAGFSHIIGCNSATKKAQGWGRNLIGQTGDLDTNLAYSPRSAYPDWQCQTLALGDDFSYAFTKGNDGYGLVGTFSSDVDESGGSRLERTSSSSSSVMIMCLLMALIVAVLSL